MKIHSALAFAVTIASAEALALSMFVDARPLLARASWLGHAGDAMAIAVVAFVAVLVISGEKLLRVLAELDHPRPRKLLLRAFYVCAHLASYFALLVLTIAIFTRVDDPPIPVFIAAWPVLGASTVATLFLVFVPARGLYILFSAAGRSLLIGGATGVFAWMLAGVTEAWWQHLSRATMMFAVRLLWLFPGKAQLSLEELTISARDFRVIIAKECSGYEGIALILTLLGLYFIVHGKELRFPRALILIPVAILGAFVANVLRVTLLVLIGAWISPELATDGFHSKLGWILFSALALFLVWVSRREMRAPHETSSRADLEPYLVPLLVVIATALFTGLLAARGIDYLYLLRIATGALALYFYRDSYPEKLRLSLGAVVIGLFTFFVWMAFDRALPATPQAPPMWWALGKALGSIVIIPVVEELAFRGYLMRRLPVFGVFLSSLAFGVVHERFIAGTLSGFLFAYAATRRGRVGDAIIAHVTANACIAVAAIVFERWSLFY